MQHVGQSQEYGLEVVEGRMGLTGVYGMEGKRCGCERLVGFVDHACFVVEHIAPSLVLAK